MSTTELNQTNAGAAAPAPHGSGRVHLSVAAAGLALGASLGMIGFGDFAELNAMFTLRDFRMLLTFMGAVGVAGVLFLVFRQKAPASVRIHKGIVPGAVLFGAGWAISGGCPSIPIVQLGTGCLPAIVTMIGIAVGMKAYRKLNARVFHFDAGACNL